MRSKPFEKVKRWARRHKLVPLMSMGGVQDFVSETFLPVSGIAMRRQVARQLSEARKSQTRIGNRDPFRKFPAVVKSAT